MASRRSAVLLVVMVLGVLFSMLYFAFISSAAPETVTVVIPAGSSLESSEHKNFEPAEITVVIGVNNTISWVNRDSVPSSVIADNDDDPAFARAARGAAETVQPRFLQPGESFEFTFTKPGIFGYHSEPHPWKHGAVVVLPSDGQAAMSGVYSKVTIEGLKDTHRTGEQIDFFVKVEGHGCDLGFPHVLIKQVGPDGQEEIVWSRFGEIRLFPAGYDCPLADFYQVRHIGDVQRFENSEQERLRTDGIVPIILQEGTYAVEMEGGNARSDPLRSEFRITAD